MKSKLVALLLLVPILIASCSDENKKYEIGIDDFYGVWANADCELVKTSLYEIFFERADNKITASIRLLSQNKNQLFINTRGIAQFDTLTKGVIIKAKDLLYGDNIAIDYDFNNAFELDTMTCTIQKYPEMLAISDHGEVVEELSRVERRLRILSPTNNWQNLNLIEKLEVTLPYEEIKAAKNNLGVCLHQWQLGTSFMVDSSGVVRTIEIGTNKHSYAYTFSKQGDDLMVYCRAARIRSDNDGTVFAQNIRLMSNLREFTAFMYPNDEAISSQDLVIADSLFNPKECVFAPEAIYWSVKSFNDTTIVLNGCGQDYTYERPHVDSGRIIEWFEFVEY